jgi:hypothetical protein
MQAMGEARCRTRRTQQEHTMNPARSYPPVRRHARVASGLVGALIGLGVVAAVIQGMGAQSGGQSLGQFVAAQRAVAQQPMAQATVPAAAEAPVGDVARGAV